MLGFLVPRVSGSGSLEAQLPLVPFVSLRRLAPWVFGTSGSFRSPGSYSFHALSLLSLVLLIPLGTWFPWLLGSQLPLVISAALQVFRLSKFF